MKFLKLLCLASLMGSSIFCVDADTTENTNTQEATNLNVEFRETLTDEERIKWDQLEKELATKITKDIEAKLDSYLTPFTTLLEKFKKFNNDQPITISFQFTIK